MLLLAEYGGEVVDLRTTDASGATFETRLWVVDDSGSPSCGQRRRGGRR
jgi:hypothetical protein